MALGVLAAESLVDMNAARVGFISRPAWALLWQARELPRNVLVCACATSLTSDLDSALDVQTARVVRVFAKSWNEQLGGFDDAAGDTCTSAVMDNHCVPINLEPIQASDYQHIVKCRSITNACVCHMFPWIRDYKRAIPIMTKRILVATHT